GDSECSIRIGRIDGHGKVRGPRQQLVQGAEPLSPDLHAHEADTGDVAARLVEAGDETSLDRIEAAAEDDRNGRGRGFGRECRRYEVWRDDDGYPAADQIGRQFRQPIIVIVRPEVFDGHVLALDIASFAEPFSECCDKICAPFGRTTEEKPDHWPRRLLRVRRDRPRRRAAEQRDEVATLHYSITSSARASNLSGT